MHSSRTFTRIVARRPAQLRADDEPVQIGPGVCRFRDPARRHAPLPPFPALLGEPRAIGPAPVDFPVRPLFTDMGARRVVLVDGEPGTSYYGMGECCGPLERSGRSVTCWNTDCFGYDSKSPSLYQSHPWALAVRRDGSAYGVMVETTFRCRVTTDRTVVFECDGHSPGVIVIDAPSPQDVVRRLAELTGFMPMPPRWALGYQQCRWSYEPESRVREIAAEFRARRIPCDVLWLDIDYMDGFRCFTFDRGRFPNPAGLNADLHSQGFRTVWMIDPGIKVDPQYPAYPEGGRAGHFVRTAAGREYHGSVWPGDCAFPDFTAAPTRAWWASLLPGFLAHGIDGVWNDMNEPAVFDGPGKSMPGTNHHGADEDLGGPGSHVRYHNIYGMQMARATREGIARARPDARPFVLTRSNFLGGQRYAATWTGDNTSDWKHLRWSVPMVLNLGLSGQPFCGPDIGGFMGDATSELFARWMGIGALLPFARGHSHKGSGHHEPWSFGQACERACRLALERRYRLLPYLYTLFHEAHTTGLPVARPLFFADPADAGLRAVDDAFLLGADVLVVTHARRIGAPKAAGEYSRALARWRRFEPCPEICDELPHLYVRPGTIVPLGPVVQHVDEHTDGPLTLVIHPDDRSQASGTMYDDRGDGPTDGTVTHFLFSDGALRPLASAGSASFAGVPICRVLDARNDVAMV